MRTLITKIFAVSGLALLMLSSCKKDGQLTTVTDGSTTPSVLTASTTAPVLDRSNPTSTAITFAATKTNYNFNAIITYTLQVDIKGKNFSSPVSTVLSSLNQAFTTADFNRLIIGLNKPNVSTQYEARVLSSLSATAGFSYSNVVTITATAFPAVSYIYVVGAFQGWSLPAADSLYSTTPNIYTGIINFTTGNREFLVLPLKTTYDNKYATNDAANTTSANVVSKGNNNLTAPATAGQYLVTINLNTNTITFQQVNVYSVIGSTTAGGNYTTDVDLKYINDGLNVPIGGSPVYTLSNVFAFTSGAFKIRQNHDWTFSWGDVTTPDGKNLTNSNGKDINVATAGNYKVTFTIALVNFGAPSSSIPTTATYTIVKQ